MIDTHCHIDLYENPLQVAKECEKLGIIAIGMTNLPSHFEMGYRHLMGFKHVRLALGMHPLHAESHEDEMPKFLQHLSKTSYIGEVGLDFSREGIATRETQVNTFTNILISLSSVNKILSIHSRRAEKEVLALLIKHRIMLAIFHWYSGPLNLIPEIVNAGYYFSINPAMLKSNSGQQIIAKIPLTNMLTESDGPFIEVNGIPAKPKDVLLVHKYLASQRGMDEVAISEEIKNNFKRILTGL